MRIRILLSCLAVAAVVVTGCGSSSSSSSSTTTVTAPAATATTTATATAPAATATTVAPSTSGRASAGGSRSGLDGVPAYEPSSVVSRAPRSLVLMSTDSVAKVGSFYVREFSGGGWQTVSKVLLPASASFTVKKNGTGATVSVCRFHAALARRPSCS